MQQAQPMHFKWDGTDSTLLNVVAVIGAVISWTTFGSIMACAAGLSTVLLNVYKWWRIKNNKNRPDE